MSFLIFFFCIFFFSYSLSCLVCRQPDTQDNDKERRKVIRKHSKKEKEKQEKNQNKTVRRKEKKRTENKSKQNKAETELNERGWYDGTNGVVKKGKSKKKKKQN